MQVRVPVGPGGWCEGPLGVQLFMGLGAGRCSGEGERSLTDVSAVPPSVLVCGAYSGGGGGQAMVTRMWV